MKQKFFYFVSLSLIACGAQGVVENGADPQFGASAAAQTAADAALQLSKSLFPDAFTTTNKFGQPMQGDAILKVPNLRGEWPEFKVSGDDTVECLNYPGSYTPMKGYEFNALAQRTAMALGDELQDTLAEKYPDLFSDVNKFGQPKRGRVIVKEAGIKGDWPEFVTDAFGRISCLNYPGSYPEMRLGEFTDYVTSLL